MNDKKIKILFILPSLKAGGAERIISYVAQNLNREKFDVTLIIQGYKKDQVFDVEYINLIFLEKPRLVSAIISIYKKIKEIRPNIVVGSIGHVNLLLGFFSFIFTKIQFVAREASVNNIMSEFATKKQLPFWIRKILYRRLDTVICQSKDMEDDIKKMYNINKSIIINNPVTIDQIDIQSLRSLPKKATFVTIGRLSLEKGHERILHALKNIDLDFEYIIIGSGPLKKKIEKLIEDYNLKSKVTLIDFSNDVRQYLLNVSLYLQGSFVEGFPNALLEAVSTGIPSIAFNCPGGTKEIIKSDFNGYIVENETEFKVVIIQSIIKDWQTTEIVKDAFKRFGSEVIISQYNNLFSSIYKK